MKEIEFVIPEGYKKSDKSTENKLVFEYVEKNTEKEAREFLIDIFNKMKVRIEESCPGKVFYDVGGLGTVFEQDFKNENLWVSHKHIWSVFENHLSMNIEETQTFIRGMVEDILNWKGLTPKRLNCM